MSVIWKYLNKRSGAIDAIRDYDSMKFIIENTSEDIKQAYAAMTSLHPSGFDGMPHSSNPHATEDHIISGLADIDILKERYRQAVEYMAWFQPAWEKLSSDEQYVLQTFMPTRMHRRVPSMPSLIISTSSGRLPTKGRIVH